MAAFFHPQKNLEDNDSAALFSATDSPEESTTSPSSSFYHSPPPQLPSLRSHSTQTHEMAVRNLSYSIQPDSPLVASLMFRKPEPVNVLNSVSFAARSSEILAIVGPSGTGKSTLIRVMAGRVQNRGFDPKTVSINGRPMTSPVHLRKVCGFVAQEDDLLPLLTVRETLMFGAKFRLREMSTKEKEERVEGLIHELGLAHAADTYIGDEEKRGISGGERRRVSIGVDLINEPPILLLDEPTSGLDSKSALQVIELLSSMAKTKRRTVVISIHQPSYRILGYLSKYLVLSRGSVAHYGSLRSLEETISRKIGLEIPAQLNALEFAMENLPQLEEAYSNNGHGQSFYTHDLGDDPHSYSMWPEIEIAKVEETDHQDQKLLQKTGTSDSCSMISHFIDAPEIGFLCSRFWKIIFRTKQLLLARTTQAIIGGFGLGSVYIKARNDDERAGGVVAERLGLFAFSLSFLLSSTVEALPIYLRERRVLMKECSRGSYKISSYMVANTIVFLPFLLAVALLFAGPLYWIVGLNPSTTAFAFFVFVVWVIILMASSLVMFLSAVSPDFISGSSLICAVLGAFFLFSGYFIPKDNIPKYWLFMYYASLYRYPLDSLITNEYWNARGDCFSWDRENRCVLTGDGVLKSRGLDQDTRWMNVGIMLGFFVFYRVLCWFILVRRASKTII